ncbi:hypothetical protein Taitung203_10480 [Helicobacter pylori]
MDRSRDKFVSNLNNSVFDAIERFKSDLSEKMYAHIDRDIENEECEEIFENECKQRTVELHENIERCLLSSIASLVFGLFNFWNPVGWASIGLGLTGIVTSVWSWFSSDYKKSQQRKAVDKNLNKVCEKIEEGVRNQIEDAKKGICEKVENLKAGLNDPVVCYERMREGLIKASEGLWQISNNIKTRIAQ